MEKLDRFLNLVTDFSDVIDFLIVYIQEAHPEDGFTLSGADGVTLYQHRTLEDRIKAAKVMTEMVNNCPIVVDTLQNTGTMKYAAFPDGAIVIGIDNKLTYNDCGLYNFKNLQKWVEDKVHKYL